MPTFTKISLIFWYSLVLSNRGVKGDGGGVGDGKANLASHEYFLSDPHQHWYIRCPPFLSSTVTATKSEWAESVSWWFSSSQLQRKFSHLLNLTSQHKFFFLGAPSRWRGTQSCSLSAQAQLRPPWAQELYATSQREQFPPAQEGRGGPSALTEHHLMSQSSSHPSWRRMFSLLRRMVNWTGKADSCSTGSPPPPSPPPPPSQPPSVSSVSPAHHLVPASAASLQIWSCCYLVQCLTDINFVNSRISSSGLWDLFKMYSWGLRGSFGMPMELKNPDSRQIRETSRGKSLSWALFIMWMPIYILIYITLSKHNMFTVVLNA